MENNTPANLRFKVGQKVLAPSKSSNWVGEIIEAVAPGEWAGTKVAGATGRFRVNWGSNKTWWKGDALVLAVEGPDALASAIVDHVAQEEPKDLYPQDKTVVLSLTIEQLEDIELALLLHAAKQADARALYFTELAGTIAGHNPNK